MNLVKKYLDKHYIIKDNIFIGRYDDKHEWGSDISKSLTFIFSLGNETCEALLKDWANENGLSNIDLAWYPRKLKTKFSPEMAMDLQAYGVTHYDKEIIEALSNELSKEIDITIINQLKIKINTIDEFLSIIKCVGYEFGECDYDRHDFKPRKHFIGMNYNDIKNAQQNNHIWQNHFRPTRTDNET